MYVKNLSLWMDKFGNLMMHGFKTQANVCIHTSCSYKCELLVDCGFFKVCQTATMWYVAIAMVHGKT